MPGPRMSVGFSDGTRVGADEPRERYFLGADLARELRSIGDEYKDIYQSAVRALPHTRKWCSATPLPSRHHRRDAAAARAFGMRTTRSMPLAEIIRRTGLTADEVRRFNPALAVRPRGCDALPPCVRLVGRDVSFWRRQASSDYSPSSTRSCASVRRRKNGTSVRLDRS